MFEKLISIGLPVALILVMIGVGMSLQWSDFKNVMRVPKAFFVGVFAQLILLPLLAVAVINMYGLSGALGLGLLVVALCPGGVTSNLFTYLAKGDVGLSVSLTAIVGFITPFTIPLILAWGIGWQGLEHSGFDLPVGATVTKLLVVSVVPVLIGMFLRRRTQKKQGLIESIVRKLSSAVLAFVIIALYLELGHDKMTGYMAMVGPACVTLNIAGMLLGVFLARAARLNRGQSTCVMLEVGLQNGTIALLVTMELLKSEVMSIAPMVYSLWMMVPAFLVVALAKRRVGQPAA
ncbi:bile acid:sodium symporter family protein [Rubritalea marina]|uniref:bile acid:sodium symporter family protein n=1 Tax=Rubritalea marina TaxID=361055 RepID=UPI0003A41A3D|nr:bile acid:sodium symporter [Rubritalea marina]